MLDQILTVLLSHIAMIYDFTYEIIMLVLTLVPVLKSKKPGIMKIKIPIKKAREKMKS